MARVRIAPSNGNGQVLEVDDRSIKFFPNYVVVEVLDSGVGDVETYPSRAEMDFRYVETANVGNAATADGAALRAAFLSRAELPVFTLTGTDTTGATDESTAFLALLQQAYNAGGGTIQLPRGITRVDAQVLVPNNGATPAPKQPPIWIKGAGARFDGHLTAGLELAPGGTLLDLRYAGATAKIVTTGRGLLGFDDLTLGDLGVSSTPFVLSTNTTLRTRGAVSVTGNPTKSGTACDQDVFVLGGTSTSSSAGLDGPFQGYGTTLQGVIFSRIRRGVYGRTYCNAVTVADNTWDVLCGATTAAAAIEFDGTGGACNANRIIGNLFELVNYSYGVTLRSSSRNMLVGNAFYDTHAGMLACIRLVGSSIENEASATFFEDVTRAVESNGNNMLITGNGAPRGTWVFGGGKDATIIRPQAVPASTDDVMLQVRRSLAEATSANGDIFKVLYSGSAFLRGRPGFGPSWTLQHDNGTQLAFDHTSLVKNTGDLDLYAGNDQPYRRINIARGVLKFSSFTTAARPSASGAGKGGTVYDETLNKLITSDGTNWRDQSGTVV